jgi:hypothetical protein
MPIRPLSTESSPMEPEKQHRETRSAACGFE